MRLDEGQKRRVRELLADEGHRCSNCGGEYSNVGEAHKFWGEERHWVPVGCENRCGQSIQFFLEGEQASYVGLTGPQAERRARNPRARSPETLAAERIEQLETVCEHLANAIENLTAARDAVQHYVPDTGDPSRFLHLDASYLEAYVSSSLDRARQAYEEGKKERDALVDDQGL